MFNFAFLIFAASLAMSFHAQAEGLNFNANQCHGLVRVMGSSGQQVFEAELNLDQMVNGKANATLAYNTVQFSGLLEHKSAARPTLTLTWKSPDTGEIFKILATIQTSVPVTNTMSLEGNLNSRSQVLALFSCQNLIYTSR